MTQPFHRRQFLTGTAAVAGAWALNGAQARDLPAAERESTGSLRFCLNTSTIRGQGLSLNEEIELVAEAGYDGIEPWIREIQEHRESGGSLRDVAKKCADHGLVIPSAIGFATWIVNDPAERARGLEQAKRDMDLVQQIGGLRIAAPPAGATQDEQVIDLFAAAERYAALLEIGANMGVTPQVEVWGFSKNLSRLGETAFVAIESGHPDACILPDVYHIYKGGSDLAGIKLLGREAIHCFHLNDYPAYPPRAEIGDADRVYPGDGVAPLEQILGDLVANHCQCMLSLELFNQAYWEQDAATVVRDGLASMKRSLAMVVTQP